LRRLKFAMERGCPKRLVNGPCGGMDANGKCEVDGRPCPYIKLLQVRPDALEKPIIAPGFIKKPIDLEVRVYTPLMEKLVNGTRKPVIIELEPSRRGHGGRLLEQAKPFKGLADAYSITDNPLGRVQADPLAAAGYLRLNGFNEDLLLHVSCKDRNRAGLTSLVTGALWLDVRNFLALTGDWPGFLGGPHVKPVFDLDSERLIYLLRLLRDYNLDYMGGKIKEVPAFNIGGAFNPYTMIDSEIRRLKAKRRAGMEFIVTQPIFDEETLSKIRLIRKESLLSDLPIVASVMLVRNNWDARVVKEHFHVDLKFQGSPLEVFESIFEFVYGSELVNGLLIVFAGDWNYATALSQVIRKHL
jgi:5,10-methylenetetrahydrofolate reductase